MLYLHARDEREREIADRAAEELRANGPGGTGDEDDDPPLAGVPA